MKRVRCPKCDSYITFDESNYKEGEILVFECPECHKRFQIRIGVSTLLRTQRDNNSREEDVQNDSSSTQECGCLLVIENVFHYKQTLNIHLGDNVIGRYVKGSKINTPIETVDPSIDTTHCIINVKRNKSGNFIYTLRDAPSGTGTFVGNTILKDNDRLVISDGTIITIGATTMILCTSGEPND